MKIFFLFFSLAALALGQIDPGGNFPIEVPLEGVQRPTGIVAGRETNLFVATVGGQLWKVDVKAGITTMINRGGDGQALAGLCADEREQGTLYGCGRESGKLYAFDYRGVLQTIYQITKPSSKAEPHFIASCIHSRYRLMITDAYSDKYIWFPTKDKGPEAGTPVPFNPKATLQGWPVKLAGAWPGLDMPADATEPRFGAFGIEWTGKWNETAYVMHSSSGSLYGFNLTANSASGAQLIPVKIEGKVKNFPGAMGLLFDSRNELVMYIAMPGANKIAVIEFDYRNKYRAKFIRYLRGSLIDGPMAISEYGNFIYPISGKFGLSSAQRENSSYSIQQMPKHKQDITKTRNTTDPFSTIYDDTNPPPLGHRKVLPARQVENAIKVLPKAVGMLAPRPQKPAIGAASLTTPLPTPSPSKSGLPRFGDVIPPSERKDCFPAHASVKLMDGSYREMEKLQIGDRVLVDAAAQKFSTVFSFTHRDPHVKSDFVQISLKDGRALRLSPGHMVYSSDGELRMASVLKKGDILDKSSIVETRRTMDIGLYNPQTLHGDIVVNDVRVSTYTSAVAPKAAHALLSPLRSIWMIVFSSWSPRCIS